VAIYALDGAVPEIGDDCFIAPDAVLIGKVRLHARASVWFGAVLRGDNEWIEIGERTNIQDNCTLHTDPGFPLTVGAGCTIGHNAILHGCSVGNNTLIGMGAILMNGSKVGDNCVVGAGALIGERSVVPDNTLVVGTPARKVRDVAEATIEFNKLSAEVYFKRWQHYSSALKQLP